VSRKLRSKAAWSDAASYTMADITMLRTELVIGYVVAGFLAVLVPDSAWHAVFFEGHGFWTTLENVIGRPRHRHRQLRLLGRNVPLAAGVVEGRHQLRWRDQLHLRRPHHAPLLVIYRKYYGTKLALRLLLVGSGQSWPIAASPSRACSRCSA